MQEKTIKSCPMVTRPQYSGIAYSTGTGSSIFFLRGNVDTELALVMPISAGFTLYSNTGIFFPIIFSTGSSLITAGMDLVTKRIDSAKSQMNPRFLRANIDAENVPNLENYIRIARDYDVRSVESIRFKGLLSWFRSFSLVQTLLIMSIYHRVSATIMQVYQESKTAAGLTLSEWTKKFWEWILQLSDEANPVTSVGPARPWRYAGRQPTQFQKECMEKYGESVWFIAAAPYAEPNSVIQIYIPVGNWWFLIAPAITCSSGQLYPSLNTIDKVRKHVKEDINKTFELWTILDGFSIPWYYVDNTDSFIDVKGVPTKESKNMVHQDLADDTIQTLQCGYWNFIEPLEPGDHLLTIHSRSPIYRVDITYQLSINGPAYSTST